MQTFVRALLYLIAGLVFGAIACCLVALIFGLDQQAAAYTGAGVGALAGLAFGRYRRFA